MLSVEWRRRNTPSRNVAQPLALISDQFTGIDTSPFTVVVTDVWTWEQKDIDELVGFLKLYKFKHLRRGWCKDGYAVVFSTIERAALFRMLYPGNTKPIVAAPVGSA